VHNTCKNSNDTVMILFMRLPFLTGHAIYLIQSRPSDTVCRERTNNILIPCASIQVNIIKRQGRDTTTTTARNMKLFML
jgi:hypothetical protein